MAKKNELTWGKVYSVMLPLCGLIASQAIEMYKNSVDRYLTCQVATSLNETNRQLEKKGIITDPLFVKFKKDSIKYIIADKNIQQKRKKQAICTKEYSLDAEDLESKILE